MLKAAFRRADVAEFAKIPDELRALPQWWCWKIVNGEKAPVDAHTEWFRYAQEVGATFAEAVACFVAHEDLLGLFFQFKPSDPWCSMLLSAEAAGCNVAHGYIDVESSRKQVRR